MSINGLTFSYAGSFVVSQKNIVSCLSNSKSISTSLKICVINASLNSAIFIFKINLTLVKL